MIFEFLSRTILADAGLEHVVNNLTGDHGKVAEGIQPEFIRLRTEVVQNNNISKFAALQ